MTIKTRKQKMSESSKKSVQNKSDKMLKITMRSKEKWIPIQDSKNAKSYSFVVQQEMST
jgi:hypothetical protein